MSWGEPKTYAVKHKDSTIRELSRSGGIFTALSDKVLNDGGIVYGCVLTENFEALHIRASSAKDRNRMRGSKYIQSTMGDVFRQVKGDLNNGSKVLFSGTSCQVAGLRSYLQKEYENLICVDIVCHGVPSPLVWKKYLEWQEQKNNGKITAVEYRNKTDYGWRDHVESLWFENKRVDSRIFTTLFYGHMIVRPCCYKCPYKDVVHPGDITIADYWGIEKVAPKFDDDKGVSLVIINSDKGNDMFKVTSGDLEYCATELSSSIQTPLIGPYDAPDKREQFWSDFDKKSFNYIVKQYGGAGIKSKTSKIMRALKRKIVSHL